METKDVLAGIRKRHGLTQAQMAEKTMVTRQAVSRWESGQTIPGSETLKLISKTFNVSINTLLGQPVQLQCQACGMPLTDDANIAREPDGSFNEKYCQFCWVDGKYVGASTLEEMIEACVPHMPWATPEQAREYLRQQLPQLERWKQVAK